MEEVNGKLEKSWTYSGEQKKIGMLTPSSNTALEPVCSKMVMGLEDIVTMHYSRFCVTEISNNKNSTNQFSFEPMLNAAKLLADADVDVIAWNGTSGTWLGFDQDRQFCAEVEKRFGIPATTSALAMLETIKASGNRTIHLVSPYLPEINSKIIMNFKNEGINIVNEQTSNISTVNRSFQSISYEKTFEMMDKVFIDKADGVIVDCTNMDKAILHADKIEKTYKTVLHDSIGSTVWHAMKIIDLDPSIIKGWGSIFNIK